MRSRKSGGGVGTWTAILGVLLGAVFAGCGSDDEAPQGNAGSSGRSSGGASGRATGGTAGNPPDGSAGSAGSVGNGGSSGAAGSSGGGGADGNAGSSGTSGAAGTGGTVGTAGGAGTNGASGSAGTTGASGTAGTGGTAGTNGAGGSGACGAISTFADGLTPAREIHVATNGTANGDGSAGSPVNSVQRGIQLATPGTAVRIHAGTYAGGAFVTATQGMATAPIWIGGMPGEARPVIEGGADAMHLVRPRYLVIHDLEIRNQTANGLNVDDGSQYANQDAARYVVFRNLFIHDIGSGGNQDCLKLSGLNDYRVLDSRFARCGGGGSGSAVDHVGCHRGLLARNLLEDLQGNGIQSKGGSEDIEIRWNRINNGGERAVNMGGSTGTEFFRPPLTNGSNFEARNIRAIANVFVGSTVPIAFVGCVDCLAANNTIVDPDNWIVRILQETVSDASYTFLPAQNGRFVNNIVYFSRAALSTYVNVGPNTQANTFVFRNNVWFAHDNAGQSTPTGLPSAETGGIYGQNPALVTPAYSIPSSSPAAGVGIRLTEVTGDYNGRCYLDPPSAGAFER